MKAHTFTVCRTPFRRYVRLTLTDWPDLANVPLGILEFTVFGKSADSAPEAPK